MHQAQPASLAHRSQPSEDAPPPILSLLDAYNDGMERHSHLIGYYENIDSKNSTDSVNSANKLNS
jgi:hypothetical protein